MSRDVDTWLRTTVYRKPTHTDRLLDQSSYNQTSHRAITVRTLTRRAQIICDSADSLCDENEHLRQIFHKNDYSDEFIYTNNYKQNKQNDEYANTETKNELTTVSLPYIRGTSETIARILKPFNTRIAHKPTRTLRHLLTNVKDKDDPKDRQGTVYRIRCNDCNGTYIGETRRTLTTRLGEHQTATEMKFTPKDFVEKLESKSFGSTHPLPHHHPPHPPLYPPRHPPPPLPPSTHPAVAFSFTGLVVI